MGFPRQEYWSGLPIPSPGDLCDLKDGTRVCCIASGFFTAEPPGKPQMELWYGVFNKRVRSVISR